MAYPVKVTKALESTFDPRVFRGAVRPPFEYRLLWSLGIAVAGRRTSPASPTISWSAGPSVRCDLCADSLCTWTASAAWMTVALSVSVTALVVGLGLAAMIQREKRRTSSAQLGRD